ncbi:meiotic spindle pole body protein Kms1 [Ranunculus cassubicifolius]
MIEKYEEDSKLSNMKVFETYLIILNLFLLPMSRVPLFCIVEYECELMIPRGSHGTYGQWLVCGYMMTRKLDQEIGLSSISSIGSGLHTFVLYLGPHIALFTIKAMQCGRVDLKSAPYDTIQLKRGPSWLDKSCSDFGPPVFQSLNGLSVPLSSILPQVQLEAVLWGIGTALGELPPYFISRAARISGGKVDEMIDLDDSSSEDGWLTRRLNLIKHWFLTHSQHLNFFTILVLASVPNPLFDLAGIMCGAIRYSTLEVFPCNVDWKGNYQNSHTSLGFVPGVSSVLPKVIAKLHLMKEKYLKTPASTSVPSAAKAKVWDLSFASIWNTIVWLMLVNFFIKIVTSTAQRYRKKEQDKELRALTDMLSTP